MTTIYSELLCIHILSHQIRLHMFHLLYSFPSAHAWGANSKWPCSCNMFISFFGGHQPSRFLISFQRNEKWQPFHNQKMQELQQKHRGFFGSHYSGQKRHHSNKSWMGPNPNGTPIDILDTQVFRRLFSGSCWRFLRSWGYFPMMFSNYFSCFHWFIWFSSDIPMISMLF